MPVEPYDQTATNILSLPFVTIGFTNGTNEDWIDSLLYLVPDGSGNVDNYPQFDLRGINFKLQVRIEADDPTVILQATTDDGTLSIGAYPNYGWLIIDIPVTTIQQQFPGNYVGDIVATDQYFTRRAATLTYDLVEGITRPADIAATLATSLRAMRQPLALPSAQRRITTQRRLSSKVIR